MGTGACPAAGPVEKEVLGKSMHSCDVLGKVDSLEERRGVVLLSSFLF